MSAPMKNKNASKKEKKTSRIVVQCLPEEKKKWMQFALSTGYNLSVWIRKLLSENKGGTINSLIVLTAVFLMTSYFSSCSHASCSVEPIPTPMQNDSIEDEPVELVDLPVLKDLINRSRNGEKVTINIVGFGSSVGVGATLPDPATQAPVAYFGMRLNELYGNENITINTMNRSVNGSVVSQMINDSPNEFGYWQSFVNEGISATVVVFVYGMNDGMPGAFNTGQTFPYVYTQLLESIELAKDSGADVVVLTSPHPISTVEWSMPFGTPQIYPTYIDPEVGPEMMTPPASQSIEMMDVFGNGVLIPVSVRHFQVNESMRKAAIDSGVTLIDSESDWFNAIQSLGSDIALFNENEFTHPNLTGHQLSYQIAIDKFLNNFMDNQ